MYSIDYIRCNNFLIYCISWNISYNNWNLCHYDRDKYHFQRLIIYLYGTSLPVAQSMQVVEANIATSTDDNVTQAVNDHDQILVVFPLPLEFPKDFKPCTIKSRNGINYLGRIEGNLSRCQSRWN